MHGDMETEDRERIKAAFRAGPDRSDVRILLATGAAAEGIDLQNHCSRLIHYEIPWNPNRMEQRNGRIDRHGQRAKEVLVYHKTLAGDRRLQATGECCHAARSARTLPLLPMSLTIWQLSSAYATLGA